MKKQTKNSPNPNLTGAGVTRGPVRRPLTRAQLPGKSMQSRRMRNANSTKA